MSTITINSAERAFTSECQGQVTALAANCKLWKLPFRAGIGASPGELIAQMQASGPDNPMLQMREPPKKFSAGYRAAEKHLDAADEQAQKLWLAAQWLKSGVPPVTGSADHTGKMPVQIDEPLSSYVRTLVDGGRAGLVDTKAIANELLSLVNQAEERLAAIRRSGRKYISTASIILTKEKAAYLDNFPKWKSAVPGLLAKVERLTKLHRAQFPTHRRTAVNRRGAGA